MTVILGFDTSAYQLGAYAGGGGYGFALTKASEGVGFADSSFQRHLASFRAAGIVPGAYHFGREDLGNSPEAEADWFLTVVGDPRGMLLALDLEVGNGSLWSWRDRFCDRVIARTGGPCWWYSYHNFIGLHALNTSSTPYPLWLAWPDANGPLPTYNFGGPVMQQYGLITVPGISGQVDANRFFGTIADLRALTVGGAAAAPSPTPSSEGTMILLRHPTESGRLDLIVVDSARHCAHAASPGGAGQLNQVLAWDDWGALPSGLIAPGTLTAAWDELGRIVLMASDAQGQGYLKVVRGDGGVDEDWSAVPVVVTPPAGQGPKGEPGKDAVVDVNVILNEGARRLSARPPD